MLTREQRKQLFMEDLKNLLKRHGAEMEITDDRKQYGMQSGVAEIWMDSVWRNDELLKDACGFQLPTYMDGEGE